MKHKVINKKTMTVNKKKKISSNKIQLWLMLIIPVTLVFIFCYLPMFGIVIAFKDYRYDLGIFGSEWVGLDNFIYFFKTNDFWRITKNTLVMNVGFISIGMIAAIAFAILLYEIKSRTAVKIYETIAIMPHFLSWVVVGYIAYAFLQPTNGYINHILTSIGMPTVDWYSEPKVWPPLLIFISVWKHVGMDSVLYYATMMGIDSSLYEAAAIDGAGKWKQILHVTIPQLVPVIVILLIMKMGNIFRADFGLFYQVTRDIGGLYETTDVIDTYIYRTMRVIGDMSTSSAMGLLQSVVGFILVVLTNAITKKVDDSLSLF